MDLRRYFIARDKIVEALRFLRVDIGDSVRRFDKFLSSVREAILGMKDDEETLCLYVELIFKEGFKVERRPELYQIPPDNLCLSSRLAESALEGGSKIEIQVWMMDRFERSYGFDFKAEVERFDDLLITMWGGMQWVRRYIPEHPVVEDYLMKTFFIEVGMDEFIEMFKLEEFDRKNKVKEFLKSNLGFSFGRCFVREGKRPLILPFDYAVMVFDDELLIFDCWDFMITSRQKSKKLLERFLRRVRNG